MELIMQYAATHWTAWLFATISGALGVAYRKLSKQLKEERVRTKAINEAVLALPRPLVPGLSVLSAARVLQFR